MSSVCASLRVVALDNGHGGEKKPFVPPSLLRGGNLKTNRNAVLRAVVVAGGVTAEELRRLGLWKQGGLRNHLDALTAGKNAPLIKKMGEGRGGPIEGYTPDESSPAVQKMRRNIAFVASQTAAPAAPIAPPDLAAPPQSTPETPRAAQILPESPAPAPVPQEPAVSRKEFDTLAECVAALTAQVAEIRDRAGKDATQPDESCDVPYEAPVADDPVSEVLSAPTVITDSAPSEAEPTIVIVDGSNLQNRFLYSAPGFPRFDRTYVNGSHALVPVDDSEKYGNRPLKIVSESLSRYRCNFQVQNCGKPAQLALVRHKPFALSRIDFRGLKDDLAHLGDHARDIRRFFYIAERDPDKKDEEEQAIKTAERQGVTPIVEEAHVHQAKNSEDMYIATQIVGSAPLLVAEMLRKDLPIPPSMRLVLVSGDGAASYAIAQAREVLKAFGVRLNVTVVAWRTSLSRTPRLGRVLRDEADEVVYLDQLKSVIATLHAHAVELGLAT